MVEKLDQDMVDALKKQEKERLAVIREIKAGMKQAHIDQKKELNEELMIEVVSRGIKSRKESIVEFEKGGRQDLIDKTKFEIEILEKYLPEQLSQEEIDKIIEDAFAKINPTSPKDMGKVMGFVTPLLKGKADMGAVSKTIKERLG